MKPESYKSLVGGILLNAAAGFMYTTPFYYQFNGHDLYAAARMLGFGVASALIGIAFKRSDKL